MLTFPNAKLNLGLHIIARRPDGFHDLETAFVPLPWTDALELLPAAPGQPETSLALTGRPIPGAVADNLCLRAYALLRADYPALPPARLHLHKLVPIGAGLGGGSADAAFVLTAANAEFSLHLPPEILLAYARRLGADCAFFLENRPCLATGRGDVFAPLPEVNLTGVACAVVFPALAISTAEAFAGIVPQPPAQPLRAVLAQPIAAWRGTLTNDFEAALAPRYPVLAEIKAALYAAGATYASLSGSGSAVFGLFTGMEEAPVLAWPASYTVWRGQL